jgi:hypothetical protein
MKKVFNTSSWFMEEEFFFVPQQEAHYRRRKVHKSRPKSSVVRILLRKKD